MDTVINQQKRIFQFNEIERIHFPLRACGSDGHTIKWTHFKCSHKYFRCNAYYPGVLHRAKKMYPRAFNGDTYSIFETDLTARNCIDYTAKTLYFFISLLLTWEE